MAWQDERVLAHFVRPAYLFKDFEDISSDLLKLPGK